jgi:hypothetical protein
MPKTRNDLIEHALARLGVLAAGQDPEAEDVGAIDEHIDPLVAELAARDLVVIDDIDEIDDTIFLPLAIILADECAEHFGLAGLPTTPADPDPVATAERRMREVQYARPTGEPQATEYF